MSLQYSITLNNARLDQVETIIGTEPDFQIRTGAQPANCAAANSGTLLVTIPLPSDWMNAASGATKSKTGTWSAAAIAGSASTPGHIRIFEMGGGSPVTCHLQADAAIGSGSVNFDGTITSGQTVTISTFTITAGNQ